MQRCRVEFSIKSVIEFRVREGEEEETAQELIERIVDGYAPTWIETLIRRGLQYDQIEIENYVVLGQEPLPDEELNFDY